jgi:hypothetical protein
MVSMFANNKFPENLIYKPDSAPFKAVWQRTIDAAEQYNEPGRYTALHGYEWTSLINGNNMHRVVIYRNGAAKASQMVPYTTYAPEGSPDPRDLWKWLSTYEQLTNRRPVETFWPSLTMVTSPTASCFHSRRSGMVRSSIGNT